MAVSRTVRVAIGAPLAAVVLVAGFLLFHGDFQRWRDNAALDAACGGLLDRDAVRAVLGGGQVDVDTRDGGLAHCRVSIAGSAEITVDDTTRAGGPEFGGYFGHANGATLPVPVGHGWSGLFWTGARESRPARVPTGDAEAGVALLLRCAGSGPTKSLSVTVTSELPGTLDDPANRPAYARIATTTAAKAAKARDCDTRLGGPVRSLDLPVLRDDEYEPLRTASGTCAGVPGTRTLTRATETARSGAPYEVCALSGAGAERSVLTASFGTYAQQRFAEYARSYEDEGDVPDPDRPARLRGSVRGSTWTTAKCPDGQALFELSSSYDRSTKKPSTDPAELSAERAALTAFAARSAKAHGCEPPHAIPNTKR
ncbi:hypothetical protein [Streptomyces sp. NPDC052225]|uniref:hypothetical protein n=1 Tax=Streptomyces sp. NPDC052225 TaxID=3154949 RepID=UPI0034216700